jgi:hypothetical protein
MTSTSGSNRVPVLLLLLAMESRVADGSECMVCDAQDSTGVSLKLAGFKFRLQFVRRRRVIL